MSNAIPGRGREVRQVDPEVEQVLCEYAVLRRGDIDPELDAVRAAILIEDVFGVTLTETEIDPAVLADPPALAAVLARLRGTG